MNSWIDRGERPKRHVVATVRGQMEYAELGRGYPVVVLHGRGGGCDLGALWYRWLADNHRLIAISRPGYLRTPLATGETPEEQAGAVVALMDALELETAAVMAVSAGGPVGFVLAARFPERISALVAESAVATCHDSFESFTWKPVLLSNLRQGWDIFRSNWHPEPSLRKLVCSGGAFDADEVAEIVGRVLADPVRREFLLRQLRTLYPRTARRAGIDNDRHQLSSLKPISFDQIRAPTLICHGNKDSDVSPSHAHLAAQRISGAELFLSVDGFHCLPLADDWQDIREAQRAFLAAHAPHGECSSARPRRRVG